MVGGLTDARLAMSLMSPNALIGYFSITSRATCRSALLSWARCCSMRLRTVMYRPEHRHSLFGEFRFRRPECHAARRAPAPRRHFLSSHPFGRFPIPRGHKYMNMDFQQDAY